jgi:WS/DGAT/MGAT family acyltransferase
MAVTDSMFLLGESREHPTHVAGLQLFKLPPDAGPGYVSDFYQSLLARSEVSRSMRRRPYRSIATLGQWAWADDNDIELDYHVRLSALPSPGRVRELLALVSRLHGALLDRHRPLWEFYLVEGLAGGRFATYTKVHHALMDGVTAMRVLTRGLPTDPTAPAAPPWAPRARRADAPNGAGGSNRANGSAGWATGFGAFGAARDLARRAGELAGTPPAVANALVGLARDNGAARPFDAPPTMFNVPIGGARRFVGQSWPLERIRAIGAAADATVNDVAVAMCSGALRQYLLDRDALPDRPLVAMLPVSLRGNEAGSGSGAGSASGQAAGNAVGAILCDLATDEADPATRLARIRASTRAGKAMLRGMTPAQVLALTGFLVGGVVLAPIPALGRHTPPPFNLIISNVPGGREVRYWDGAELLENYPLSIPVDGQAINITMTSYVDKLAFGIVGCRRSVPHLQRLVDHLDAELTALDKAVR